MASQGPPCVRRFRVHGVAFACAGVAIADKRARMVMLRYFIVMFVARLREYGCVQSHAGVSYDSDVLNTYTYCDSVEFHRRTVESGAKRLFRGARAALGFYVGKSSCT